MANYLGSSLFTSALSGLSASYMLLLNGGKSLTMNDILNPESDSVRYTVNQTFRSFLMTNFNNIDLDGDGTITMDDFSNYTSRLKAQGMTYNELAQLCSNGAGGTMSSLLDTVLSNFNEIDANHDGRVTQGEINAYRINREIKDVKEKYPKIDPSRMSLFVETDTNSQTTKTDNNDDNKVFS